MDSAFHREKFADPEPVPKKKTPGKLPGAEM
jgi:hypothetical protein